MKIRFTTAVLSLVLILGAKSTFAQAGSLDATFGNGGIVETSFGADTNNFSFFDAALAPSGDLDATFGSAGTVTTTVGLESGIAKILLQSNNEIVAVGTTHVTNGSTTEDLAIARYRAQ